MGLTCPDRPLPARFKDPKAPWKHDAGSAPLGQGDPMTTSRSLAPSRATPTGRDRRRFVVSLVLATVLVLAVWSAVSASRWVWTWLLSPDYQPAVSFSDSRGPHSGDR